MCCEAHGRIRFADLIDHIQPHRGDERLFYDEENQQPLCSTCHSTHKMRIELEYSGREALIPMAWERLLMNARQRESVENVENF